MGVLNGFQTIAWFKIHEHDRDSSSATLATDSAQTNLNVEDLASGSVKCDQDQVGSWTTNEMMCINSLLDTQLEKI